MKTKFILGTIVKLESGHTGEVTRVSLDRNGISYELTDFEGDTVSFTEREVVNLYKQVTISKKAKSKKKATTRATRTRKSAANVDGPTQTM